MADKYNFSKEQREQLVELTDSKYANMWFPVIYGSSVAIEGNSNDSYCRNVYDVNSLDIFGCGTPMYQ